MIDAISVSLKMEQAAVCLRDGMNGTALGQCNASTADLSRGERGGKTTCEADLALATAYWKVRRGSSLVALSNSCDCTFASAEPIEEAVDHATRLWRPLNKKAEFGLDPKIRPPNKGSERRIGPCVRRLTAAIVSLLCGTIPVAMIAMHKSGSFTGAHRNIAGLFGRQRQTSECDQYYGDMPI